MARAEPATSCHGGRRRRLHAGRRGAAEGARRAATTLTLVLDADAGHPGGPRAPRRLEGRRRAGAGRLRRRDRGRRRARERAKARAQARRPDRRQRRVARGCRLRRRHQRGHARRTPTAPRTLPLQSKARVAGGDPRSRRATAARSRAPGPDEGHAGRRHEPRSAQGTSRASPPNSASPASSRDPAWRSRAEPRRSCAQPRPDTVPAAWTTTPPDRCHADQRRSALAAIRAEIGDCTRCKLHTLGRHADRVRRRQSERRADVRRRGARAPTKTSRACRSSAGPASC